MRSNASYQQEGDWHGFFYLVGVPDMIWNFSLGQSRFLAKADISYRGNLSNSVHLVFRKEKIQITVLSNLSGQ